MEVITMKRKSVKIPEENTPGVYAIINDTKKICYIGQSKRRRDRCKAHFNSLSRNDHECEKMQKHYNDGDLFSIMYLKSIDDIWSRDKLLMLESYFYCCLKHKGIELYNTELINYTDNFFIRACREDPDVRKLIDMTKKK